MQTFTALEYLKIDIASNFGLDKLPWKERIAWFDDNEHQLDTLLSQAEEQALFYAGINAYRDVLEGRPIGYPISLDATASGMQWLGIMSGCKKTCTISNVLKNDDDERMDAYTALYEKMDVRSVGRDDIKKAIMTAFYGSTATPKRILPNEAELGEFYKVLGQECRGAHNLNNIILSLQDKNAYEYNWTMPDGFHVKIKVMNSRKEEFSFAGNYFDVYYKVNEPTDFDRSLTANATHSVDSLVVRELVRRCDYDPEKVGNVVKLLFTPKREIEAYEDTYDLQMVERLWNLYVKTGYLSARILDHINAETVNLVDASTILRLVDSLPEKPFKVLTVHDCFRFLPQYGNCLRKQYNLQMALVNDSRIAESIIEDIVGEENVILDRISEISSEEIMQADYALS